MSSEQKTAEVIPIATAAPAIPPLAQPVAPPPQSPTPEPIQLEPVKFEMLDLVDKDRPDPDNYYDRCAVPIAAAGQAIARSPEPARTELGPNVAWDADGANIVATTQGQVRVHESRIWVDEVLGIPGDVDFKTGNLDYHGDICIRGSVQDLFKVISGGTIRVVRDVEAAEIRAAVDLLVTGGISGKEKGHVFAGHDIQAKYLRNANAEAGHDIVAVNEISHSRVACGGRVRVEHGAIMAGHITAAGGVTCHTAGCSSDSLTILEAGIDEALRRLAAEHAPKIDADLKQIEKIRQTVEPLLRHQKGLSAAQKEKATELLYNASEVEERHQATIAMLRNAHADAQARCKEEIIISSTVESGVIVRFNGLEATLPAGIRGPVRISPRTFQNERQIVVNSRNGTSSYGLETRKIKDPAMDALARILASQPQPTAAAA